MLVGVLTGHSIWLVMIADAVTANVLLFNAADGTPAVLLGGVVAL